MTKLSIQFIYRIDKYFVMSIGDKSTHHTIINSVILNRVQNNRVFELFQLIHSLHHSILYSILLLLACL